MTVADFPLQKALATDTDPAISAASVSDIHRDIRTVPKVQRGVKDIYTMVSDVRHTKVKGQEGGLDRPPPAMSTHRAEAEAYTTQPASSILRTGTAKVVEEIGKSKGATYFATGELDREEYVRCLMIFWHIYKYVFSPIIGVF